MVDARVCRTIGVHTAEAEETRLLYVAFTRAERQLTLSWAERRSFGTRSQTRRRSPLLDQVEIACGSDAHIALVWEKALRHIWPVTLGAGIPATLTRPGRALIGLCDWIETDFALVVQWDGYVLRPSHWHDSFLEFEISCEFFAAIWLRQRQHLPCPSVPRSRWRAMSCCSA